MSQVVERNNSAVLGYNLNDGVVARLRDSVTRHSIAATGYIYIKIRYACYALPRGLIKSCSSPKLCACGFFFVMSVGFKLRPLKAAGRGTCFQSLGSMHPCTCHCRRKEAPESPKSMCGRVRPREFIRSPPITKLKLEQG